MPAEVIIDAIGEEADLSCLPYGVKLSETGVDFNGYRIFGGGDAITGAGSVVEAIASGRRAARFIDSYLGGANAESESITNLVSFADLNTTYFVHHDAHAYLRRGISNSDRNLLSQQNRFSLNQVIA